MNDLVEKQAIRELVENWALWRDAGVWQRFRGVWHDDGRMMATWFQGGDVDGVRCDVAYIQTKIGYAVKPDMPGLKCEAVQALYAEGAAWLRGRALGQEP